MCANARKISTDTGSVAASIACRNSALFRISPTGVRILNRHDGIERSGRPAVGMLRCAVIRAFSGRLLPSDENDHGTHVVCATSTSGSDPRHMTPLHPKKLLLTKWTAVQPIAKNKHFFVSRVIEPEPPELAIEWVELEAVYSKAVTRIHWRQLQDETLWRRGWQSAGRQQP